MKNLLALMMLLVLCLNSCLEISTVNAQTIDREITEIENNLLPGVRIKGTPKKTYQLLDRMDYYNVLVMTNGDNGRILLNEYLKSVSGFYNWNIYKQRVVEPIDFSVEQLEK